MKSFTTVSRVCSLFAVIAGGIALQSGAEAQTNGKMKATAGPANGASVQAEIPKGDPAFSRFGMTYFSFFDGPGLDPDLRAFPPNQFGRPSDDGLNFFNIISVRYRLTKDLAIDLQTRSVVILNNGVDSKTFVPFRWESPRLGISGKLASGKDWSLSGAVNTDLPYILPSPLTGYTSRERQILFNPGMFANFSYTPSGSRWSLFAVIAPRYFFYADDEALEPQSRRANFSGRNKPELALAFTPTVNYQLTSRTTLTSGIVLDYRKQVGSSWNPFQASMVNNGDSTAWRLQPIAVQLGVTHEASSAFRIYPFIQGVPIAAQRISASTGQQASFGETLRFGMWISGTIL
ncbi:MAG: hypothetical protein KGP28_03810 [Bdellovibrionales bacterium]|nr:hypothetical protein [Bdellovibrionales bacterium]